MHVNIIEALERIDLTWLGLIRAPSEDIGGRDCRNTYMRYQLVRIFNPVPLFLSSSILVKEAKSLEEKGWDGTCVLILVTIYSSSSRAKTKRVNERARSVNVPCSVLCSHVHCLSACLSAQGSAV